MHIINNNIRCGQRILQVSDIYFTTLDLSNPIPHAEHSPLEQAELSSSAVSPYMPASIPSSEPGEIV